jgi:simple sugar transport system permease protein
MIAGEFDLSIGSLVGAGSITVGVATGFYHAPLLLGVAVAAVIALIVGLGNGLLVTRTGLPSFIVTLAANLIVAGLGLTITRALVGTSQISLTTSGFVSDIFATKWGAFNIAVLWWALVVLAAVWVLGQSRFGNWIFATGGDAERARRSGVRTSLVKITLFACTSLAAVFVGVLQAVEFNTGDPTTGQGYVFQAPIVVVIGGVLLTGGYGSVIGVVLGTLIYGVTNAGLFYTGWDTDYAQVIIGAFMVLAVITNGVVRRAAMSSVRTGMRR